eukprot:590689-Pleurochrysis_carterae.AAC.1
MRACVRGGVNDRCASVDERERNTNGRREAESARAKDEVKLAQTCAQGKTMSGQESDGGG